MSRIDRMLFGLLILVGLLPALYVLGNPAYVPGVQERLAQCPLLFAKKPVYVKNMNGASVLMLQDEKAGHARLSSLDFWIESTIYMQSRKEDMYYRVERQGKVGMIPGSDFSDILRLVSTSFVVTILSTLLSLVLCRMLWSRQKLEGAYWIVSIFLLLFVLVADGLLVLWMADPPWVIAATMPFILWMALTSLNICKR